MAFGNPVYKPTTESNCSLDIDSGVRFDTGRTNLKFDKVVHFVKSPHGRGEALLVSTSSHTVGVFCARQLLLFLGHTAKSCI